MSRRLALALAACAALALVPQAAPAASAPPAEAIDSIVGRVPERNPTLMVTFLDRPDRATAEARLAGLGTVRALLPEVGVWALQETDRATVRGRTLARRGVRRAEWSLVRVSHALTDPRPAPPITLPLQVLPEPTDPFYVDATKQWGLHTGRWSIGASAYDRPTIAILDSGVDSTHEEWRDSGALVFPRSTLRNVNQAEDINIDGHGTHVAGIAAAPANGIGVVGVAPASGASPDPGVSKVMPVQIADALGRSQDATMIAGIKWAVTHGAKVINISSGGPGFSRTFQTTVNWAFEKGALIVASVGNEGEDDNGINFPAGYDHVIGAGAQCDGAVDASLGCAAPFSRARFSNSNYTVDVLAPGVNITSTIPLAVATGRIAPGYGLKSGTSMAAPYVAGVAALVFASHPGITPFQVIRILESTSSRGAAGLPRTSTDGWGFIDPLAAVQAPAPVDDLAEPNDDVRPAKVIATLRPARTPVVLKAWADRSDDPVDVYPIKLLKGERVKVTLVARGGRLGALVFRPGVRSFAALSERQFTAKLLGATRRATPGVRAVVLRAKESGRHFVMILGVRGIVRGGDYTLKIQRL